MELVLPNNYVEIEEEEMMYLDGGFYISNGRLRSITFAAVAAITTAPRLMAIGISAAAKIISRVVASLLSRIGAVFGGFIGGLAGYVFGWYSGYEIGFKTMQALYYNKGLDIGWTGISVR